MTQRNFAAALLCCTAIAAPALAQQQRPDPNVPRAEMQDPRMRVQDYRPGVRTRVVNTVDEQTVVTFGPDEEIVRLNFTDGGKTWETPDPAEVNGDTSKGEKGVPLKNVLPLFAVAPGRTNLLVVTERPGGTYRPYQFALEVRPRPDCGGTCEDPDATFGLFFRYPEDEARRAAEERRRRVEATAPEREAALRRAQVLAVRDRMAADPVAPTGGCVATGRPHPLGLYEAEGNAAGRAELVPDDIRDDGRETVLRFAGNRPYPTFYLVGADGEERSILAHPRGQDLAVIPGTHREIRLRLGEAVLHIRNRSFDPAGCPTGTGTNRQDVVRRVRYAGTAR